MYYVACLQWKFSVLQRWVRLSILIPLVYSNGWSMMARYVLWVMRGKVILKSSACVKYFETRWNYQLLALTTAWRRRLDDDGLTTTAWRRRPDDDGLKTALLAWWHWPNKDGLTMTTWRWRPDNKCLNGLRTTACDEGLMTTTSDNDGLTTTAWQQWPDEKGLTTTAWH